MASKGVALITGAARGIGATIALRLASEGYNLALADLPGQASTLSNVAKQIQEMGRKVVASRCDVSREEDGKKMVQNCVQGLGGLDIMVANAGISKFGTTLTTTVEDWDALFSVNARGVFLCYKHAAEQMVKQGRGGRIVGACSSAGKRGAPMLAAYSSTKFAVRGMTQVAAQELASHNITVNCYSPAFVDTDLLSQPEDEKVGGERGAYIRSVYPFQKDQPFINPDVVAELVSYIVKPSSHMLTGECISLNGTLSFD
ncbi:hypothetical protein EIP91_005182 [Steccherinum ochraceum]|uniref:Diacetyl reductase [(S)-acetoin forming] n=1 Tax=Steccherinum ochraceum TaxID=92696 RepID=A0A4R0RAE4_9APHY|nr:hypothetical protein EIP91_005182 [Steccherinum ochraceum]